MLAIGKNDRDTRIRDLERRLTETERRLRATQALARVGSWEWVITEDEEWPSTWSPEMQRIFGRDPDGPPPTRDELLSYVHPADLPSFE